MRRLISSSQAGPHGEAGTDKALLKTGSGVGFEIRKYSGLKYEREDDSTIVLVVESRRVIY